MKLFKVQTCTLNLIKISFMKQMFPQFNFFIYHLNPIMGCQTRKDGSS